MDGSLFTSGLLASSVLFPVLASLTVASRFHTRHILAQPLLADDWTILISLALCWLCSAMYWIFAPLVGVDTIKIDPSEAPRIFLMFLYFFSIPFNIILGSVKVSILLFYKRIFPTTEFGVASNIGIAVVIAWTIAMVLTNMLSYSPVSGAWDSLSDTSTIDQLKFQIIKNATAILFDIMVLLYPIPVIRKLKMSKKRKIIVMLIFCLGGLCVGAAIARFYYAIANGQSVFTDNSPVPLIRAFYFSNLEANISVAGACFPTLRPLFAKKRRIERARSAANMLAAWRKQAAPQNSNRPSDIWPNYTNIEQPPGVTKMYLFDNRRHENGINTSTRRDVEELTWASRNGIGVSHSDELTDSDFRSSRLNGGDSSLESGSVAIKDADSSGTSQNSK